MKTRFMAKAQMCGICLNEIKVQGIINSCIHEFCFECISQWSDIENKCPICRKNFLKITARYRIKQYHHCKLKKKVSLVRNKNQRCNPDLLLLIETTEQLLTQELHRLLDNSV